ncbi:MAG: glycosyltransferase [Lachnospiraceae bacterium]|nr:glycosyltransferase [Lachnospiraceae bacterium]
MKVLHIVEAFGGGIYTYMEALLKQMSDEFEIVVAYALRPQTPDDFKEHFNNKIKFIEVKHFQRSINPINDLFAGFEIRDIVKSEKPDLIHLHSSKAGVLGRLFLNCKRNAVFYTPHGYAFMKKDDSVIKRNMYFMIEWLMGRCHSVTVGCSKGEYAAAKKVSKKAIWINNGIDYITLPACGELGGTERLLIATIGRVCYQKNPRMFNKVALSMPEADFLWVGEGDMEDELTAPNIKITGWKSREETLELLNKADVFLLLSLWEGLPISLLEAMCLKKVCVVSDVIGNRDVIINRKNGYVVNDEEECVTVLKEIAHSLGEQSMIVESAHQSVVEKYNISVMGEMYAREYRKLCSRCDGKYSRSRI